MEGKRRHGKRGKNTYTNKNTTRNIKTSEVGWEGCEEGGRMERRVWGPAVEKMVSKCEWIKVPFCRSWYSQGILGGRAREAERTWINMSCFHWAVMSQRPTAFASTHAPQIPLNYALATDVNENLKCVVTFSPTEKTNNITSAAVMKENTNLHP